MSHHDCGIDGPRGRHRMDTPEDGCLWVYGVGEDGVPAFTTDGIENLRQIIAEELTAGHGPLTVPEKQVPLR